MRKLVILILIIISSSGHTQERSAYEFLKDKSKKQRPVATFNQYEDIISGSLAFVIGNVGYFTTDSSPLKLAFSGVQTVGIIGVGHGIYDYYYPHFETRLLELLNKKKMTKGDLAGGYVELLGEMDRAKRISLLWSSSLLTMQYAINAFLSNDGGQDLKDIYLFLGGVNAIVATYSFFFKTDYEEYYQKQQVPKIGVFVVPDFKGTRTGLTITQSW